MSNTTDIPSRTRTGWELGANAPSIEAWVFHHGCNSTQRAVCQMGPGLTTSVPHHRLNCNRPRDEATERGLERANMSIMWIEGPLEPHNRNLRALTRIPKPPTLHRHTRQMRLFHANIPPSQLPLVELAGHSQPREQQRPPQCRNCIHCFLTASYQPFAQSIFPVLRQYVDVCKVSEGDIIRAQARHADLLQPIVPWLQCW